MGLMMKTDCEKCEETLTKDAFFCVNECTFCKKCTVEMSYICPKCKGELVRRPSGSKAE
jgi:uncharacterized protein